jgi:hypothetical protein
VWRWRARAGGAPERGAAGSGQGIHAQLDTAHHSSACGGGDGQRTETCAMDLRLGPSPSA